MTHATRVLVSVGLLFALAGCDSTRPSVGSPSSSSSSMSSSDPATLVSPIPIQLAIGQTRSGAIGAASQRCSYQLLPPDSGLLEGPCQVFRVVGLGAAATLDVHLTWTVNVPLSLAIPDGEANGTGAHAVCCQSPLDIVVHLYPFDVTPIAVVYTGQQTIEDLGPIGFVLANHTRK